MPTLAKLPVRISRFKPHAHFGADVGAGAFSCQEPALAARPSHSGESLDCLAHDARNVLSGLRLYCDLLAAPGVLAPEHGHYAPELEKIAGAATRIIEKVVAHAVGIPEARSQTLAPALLPERTPTLPAPAPVTDVAAEVRRLRALLAAIAGPPVRLAVDTMPCPGTTALSVEGLTRVLVNLVRNAADAMPAGGRVRITAQYGGGSSFLAPVLGARLLDATSAAGLVAPRAVLITVADNGPGIPAALRDRIFDAGFTTWVHAGRSAVRRAWPAPCRRGLGLGIVRDLVESAGGTVRLAPEMTCGALFEITVPILNPAIPKGFVTSGTCPDSPHGAFPADLSAGGCIECQ